MDIIRAILSELINNLTYQTYEKASEYDQEMPQSQTNLLHCEEETQNKCSHKTIKVKQPGPEVIKFFHTQLN